MALRWKQREGYLEVTLSKSSILFFLSDNVEDLSKCSYFPAVEMPRYLIKIPQGGMSTETLLYFFNVESSTAGPLCSWLTGL